MRKRKKEEDILVIKVAQIVNITLANSMLLHGHVLYICTMIEIIGCFVSY